MYQKVTFGTKTRWPDKTGDLLKEVQFIWRFIWQDKKRGPLDTGDCLIEVTTWTYLTVICRLKCIW